MAGTAAAHEVSIESIARGRTDEVLDQGRATGLVPLTDDVGRVGQFDEPLVPAQLAQDPGDVDRRRPRVELPAEDEDRHRRRQQGQ